MDLEYKIKTSAELAGAEAAADSLERQIGKAKALKQDYSALETQLKTLRGSIEEYKSATKSETDAADELKRANDQLADSVHTVSRSEAEMAEQSEHATISHRGLHKIAGELNRVLPGLGEVMMVAFNPVVASIVILVGVFSKLIESIKETNEEMAKMAAANIDVSRISDGTEALQAQIDTMGSGVGKADDFATATDHVADAQKKVADNTNEAITALKTQAQYEEEEAKARQKLALDQIKQKVATGQMTPAEGAAAETDITARNEREASARKSKLESDEIDARKQEQSELTAQQRDLENRKTLESGSPEAAQGRADDAKNLAGKYKKDADDQGQYLHDFGKDMSGDEYTKQMAKQKLLIERQHQQEDVADDMAEKAKAAKTEWEKTVTSLKKVNDRLAELGDQIPQLESKHDAADKHRGAMLGIQNQSNATNRVTGDIDHANKDMATVNEIQSKSTQTAGDAAKVSAALKDAHAAVADAAATIGQLAGMGADVADLKKKVAQLKAAVDHH